MHGLIKTNENCVGCNKCIRSCSCFGAQVATTLEDGRNIVEVDKDKCTLCGECFNICDHNAREYFDDTDKFFEALESGEKLVLLVAPSFFANYAKDYKKVLGKLKEMGVSEIISVGFGADISTWGYIKHINEYGFRGGIAQPCPVVVSYIEKYRPELIKKLFPVQSPLMCTAIYARKELGRKERFAFLGPCIGKKEEIESPRGKGEISFNITYKNFFKRLRKSDYEDIENEVNVMFGMGSIYPMVGGLNETIKWFLGNEEFFRHVEGQTFLYKYLNENKNILKDDNSPFLLIDALNCAQGCIYGTGVERNLGQHKEQPTIEVMKIKKDVINSVVPWSKYADHESRLKEFNEHFSNLDINDYICEYTDKSDISKCSIPNKDELEEIFLSLNKKTEASRIIDCACCGHETCENMAIAIHNKRNYKENCIYYMREAVVKEKLKTYEAELYKEIALKDLNTGLFNSNAFYEWINNETEFENKGIVITDLNDLKKCNDTFGHDYGDEFIRNAAKILKDIYNDYKIYRIGGDEFAVVIDNVNQIDFMERYNNLRKKEEEFNEKDSKIIMSMSVGYAEYDPSIDGHFSNTQKRADTEMYVNKKGIKSYR